MTKLYCTCASTESTPATAMKVATSSREKPTICNSKQNTGVSYHTEQQIATDVCQIYEKTGVLASLWKVWEEHHDAQPQDVVLLTNPSNRLNRSSIENPINNTTQSPYQSLSSKVYPDSSRNPPLTHLFYLYMWSSKVTTTHSLTFVYVIKFFRIPVLFSFITTCFTTEVSHDRKLSTKRRQLDRANYTNRKL